MVPAAAVLTVAVTGSALWAGRTDDDPRGDAAPAAASAAPVPSATTARRIEPPAVVGLPPRTDPSASAFPLPGMGDAPRTRALDVLLAERAEAVLAGDEARFLATVAPTAHRFLSAQQELFASLSALPLASWSYAAAGEGPSLTAVRTQQLGPRAWVARVQLRYRLADYDTADVVRDSYLTVVPSSGGWLLAGDTDGPTVAVPSVLEPTDGPTGGPTDGSTDGSTNGSTDGSTDAVPAPPPVATASAPRDLWDLGPVTVTEGEATLVIAAGTPSSEELARYAAEGDRAVRAVGGVWTGPWARRVVVVVPASEQQLAGVLGDADAGALRRIAAVTTGQVGPAGQGTRGDRVVLNPRTYPGLSAPGRQVVLTHETTHVATRATTTAPVPGWLSEGFADYVGYRGSGIPVAVAAGDLLAAVRAGAVPPRLPDDADFAAAGLAQSTVYEQSWLACRVIAERHGEPALVALYRRIAEGPPAGGGVGGAVADVLDTDEPALLAAWQETLRREAAA